MGFSFNSAFTTGAALPDFAQATLKDEPMLWRCSPSAARELGGPITHAFLDAVGEWSGGEWIMDSRVHMLMPGWYPCIPGWHHDDVPRSRSDGQPNYKSPEYRASNVMALVNGDICPTQFAVGQCQMPDVPLGKTIYQEWDAEVNGLIEFGQLRQVDAPSNQLVFFDCDSFHRGHVANKRGWRWFGRLTANTGLKPTNELRRQVQVYMPVPTQGW